MLKFWKKSGGQIDKNRREQTPNGCVSITTTINENNPIKNNYNKKSSPLASFDDEGLYDIGEFESIKEHSRLSKTLQEVLTDKNSLNYFKQFMETRNASNYINCWLDIEQFRAQLFDNNNEITTEIVRNKSQEHDSLSVSTDCDSLTTDLSSLNDYLVTKSIQNDDELLNSNCCDMSDTSPNSTCLINNNNSNSKKKLLDLALIIFKKYIAQEAVIKYNINCPDLIRNELIESLCEIETNLLSKCFDKVQNYIMEMIETNQLFDLFLNSNYFCKYQIDILTSGNIALDDILYNETALFYFMEYLDEQDNKRCLLEFWIAATNFHKQLLNEQNSLQAQNDAIVLYDKYFSLQAYCPLGFNNKIRLIVEENISGENGLLILDCFHLPLKIIEQILERNYLKTFLTSQLFYKYLSELINTVQTNNNNNYSLNYEKKLTLSDDTSSERSFSTNSTFLALDLTTTTINNNNKMSIDTRELCDPDSLWKRKRKYLLSCGRVTELGKFITDFEPEPDRKEFNLKNVMKKFVHTNDDQDKKKEEMAWQVAEMIVKDITSITLRQDKSSCHL